MMTENTHTMVCIRSKYVQWSRGLDASAGSGNTGIGLHTDIFPAITFYLGTLNYGP